MKERELCLDLKKWLHVEEQALQQKSRIQWLALGDSNHHFLYSAIKERFTRNKIHMWHDEQENTITD